VAREASTGAGDEGDVAGDLDEVGGGTRRRGGEDRGAQDEEASCVQEPAGHAVEAELAFFGLSGGGDADVAEAALGGGSGGGGGAGGGRLARRSWDGSVGGGRLDGLHLSDLFHASLDTEEPGCDAHRGSSGCWAPAAHEAARRPDWPGAEGTCGSGDAARGLGVAGGHESGFAWHLHVPCSSLLALVDGSGQTDDGMRGASSEDTGGDERGGGVVDGAGEQLTNCELVPFETVMETAMMRALRERVGLLNRAIVSYLNVSFHLPVHLAALRRVFFMAAGDVLHDFALYLFEKLDRGEPWSDVHALNSMLQSSLPAIPGVEYGMVSAYTAALHHEQRVRLRASDDTQDTSISALVSLRLDYAVPWPLNLIINASTLKVGKLGFCALVLCALA
jgi:hypothetical protein